MSDKPMVLNPADVEGVERQPYPAPYDKALKGKIRKAVGEALGLTKFGVNITRLEPGAQSSLRHWHSGEDEFVYILEGEATLVTDDGVQVLGPGMVAGFPAGQANGHQLVNRTKGIVTYMEVGNRAPEEVHYADADLHLVKDESGNRTFYNKSGKAY